MRRREGVTGVPGGAGPGSGQCSGRGWGPGLLPPPPPRLPPFLPLSGAQGLIRLKTMTARGDSSCTDKSATLTGPGRQGTRPRGDPASGRPGWQETGPAEFVLGTPWISFWSECTESRWESEPVEQRHPVQVCPLSHPQVMVFLVGHPPPLWGSLCSVQQQQRTRGLSGCGDVALCPPQWHSDSRGQAPSSGQRWTGHGRDSCPRRRQPALPTTRPPRNGRHSL